MMLVETITFVNKLKDRLKIAREMRGLSQDDLAKKAKCSQSTIGNVESGARESLRNLIPVARALQVSPDWLYDGRGPAPIRHAAGEPSPPYRVWPLSEELLDAMRRQPAERLRVLENVLRAHLDLDSEGSSGNAAAA